MTSTTSTPTPSSSFSINPTNLQIGQQVDIESRTWPGINKPGGHATIIKLHYDDTTAAAVPTKIDVKYVLGGSEKQIELMYVKPHVELVRGGRSRRVDRKMTVDSFGSEKENLGKKKKMMNSAAGSGGMNTNKRKNVDKVVDKSVMKKKTKKEVQNNKKKKEEDDVVPAATTKNEGEKLKVVEDDDIHQKKKQKSAPPKKMGKKKATVIAAAGGGATKTKSIASYFTTSSSSTKTTKASSSSTELSVKAKATTGPSKPKETIKKVKKTTIPTTNNNKPINTKNPKQLVKYSPNSILAVRAAHAKSPAQSHIFGTKTIGMCKDFTITSSSPGETTIPGVDKNKKKSRRGVQESLFPDDEVEEKQKSCASASVAAAVTTAVGSSLVLAPKKKVTPSSSSSVASGKKCGVSSSAQNHKTIQTLYKNECVKAQDFVKSMIGSEPQMEEEEEGEEEEDVTSSPESCLELKMDSGRMDLFNSLLSEVMFRKGIESMDVDEMICSINTSSRRGDTVKPFTLLEVKAFLQTLDSQNRIFVSWEDDNSGTIYSI